jgi:hypothetical protein
MSHLEAPGVVNSGAWTAQAGAPCLTLSSANAGRPVRFTVRPPHYSLRRCPSAALPRISGTSVSEGGTKCPARPRTSTPTFHRSSELRTGEPNPSKTSQTGEIVETPMDRSTSTSARRHPTGTSRTGYKPGQERAGSPCSAATASRPVVRPHLATGRVREGTSRVLD